MSVTTENIDLAFNSPSGKKTNQIGVAVMYVLNFLRLLSVESMTDASVV